jgi:hypothetical protein
MGLRSNIPNLVIGHYRFGRNSTSEKNLKQQVWILTLVHYGFRRDLGSEKNLRSGDIAQVVEHTSVRP